MEAGEDTSESEGYHTQEFESDDASTDVDLDDIEDDEQFERFMAMIHEMRSRKMEPKQ